MDACSTVRSLSSFHSSTQLGTMNPAAAKKKKTTATVASSRYTVGDDLVGQELTSSGRARAGVLKRWGRHAWTTGTDRRRAPVGSTSSRSPLSVDIRTYTDGAGRSVAGSRGGGRPPLWCPRRRTRAPAAQGPRPLETQTTGAGSVDGAAGARESAPPPPPRREKRGAVAHRRIFDGLTERAVDICGVAT